ncbi:hypothetical protein [Streptomyces spectabilis]|uniref:Uncharacterized protein n=1 Tax=Streptomyces spectabilis TaxID=68270 RepID=A0A7W8EXD3_STRST|nr:hypothetical protein [Streptomyces spectabilis]MBB5108942.1 hypothetical protein [Streptomyces spectabilis]GGV50292.1 hypothetical protein GCM10010245_79120 [Streptomyces spectabilis]
MLTDLITDHADALLAALLGVALTHGLNRRSRRREERAADTATLTAQVDAFTTALAAVRTVAASNRTLWERPQEKLRAAAIIGLGFLGGWARADTGGPRPITAGLAEAAHLISREVHAGKLALAHLHSPILQLAAAATPLLRHADERLAQATDAVITAAAGPDDDALDAAVRAFAQASRQALTPRPPRWTRLRSRRSPTA